MFKVNWCRIGVMAALVFGGLTVQATAADISGAGATFPYPIYGKWAEAYKKDTNIGLNYQSIGSGGGIKQIKSKTVTFGASDMPLKAEDLEAAGLIQWPQIIGGVVPVLNIKGIKPGELVLNASVIASIYLGEIKYWDDPEIVGLNPKLKLPHESVIQVYRADGSGTTFLFTNYLSTAVPKFAAKVGNNSAVEWPAGIGAKGNEGVANTTKQTEGAIGYVEYAYAKQNNLGYALLQNKDGSVVAPSIETFRAAAVHAEWDKAPGFYLVLTNQTGKDSWPITGASFILMHKKPVDAVTSKMALDFFSWAFKSGDKMATSLDYVPLPSSVVGLIEKSWSQIETK